MKKIFLLAAALLIMGTSVHAMTISQEWDKTSHVGLIDMFLSIQQTSDGGYVASGMTADYDGTNGFITKLDSNGNISWQKKFKEGGGTTIAHSIQQTTDGGYIVAGEASCGLFVFKLDTNGNPIWQKCYGEGHHVTVRQTSDRGYIVRAISDALRLLKLDSLGNVSWQKKYNNIGKVPDIPAEHKNTIQETTDGGYILAKILRVIKLDSSGNILWNKHYESGGAYHINTTTDGGYIIAGAIQGFGAGSWDFFVRKLDSNGNAIWEKAYGGSGSDYATSIQQTNDGGYVVAGGTNLADTSKLLVFKLHPNGEINWANTYTEEWSGYFPSIQQTIDGGYIVGSDYRDETTNYWDAWILKLDSNGEIGNCQAMAVPELITTDLSIPGQDGSATAEITYEPAIDVAIPLHDTLPWQSVLCYYEDPNDMDGDGVVNTPGGSMASSIYGTFLAAEDNCPDMPNGPSLGTCTAGETYKIGRLCISNAECGTEGYCSMNQEDSNGDGIGDACYLCECDFTCDGDVDSEDVNSFLTDFSRGHYVNPCTNQEPCNGDFSCDGDVDADDVTKFLEDFGRGQYSQQCPACTPGPWCVYP